MRRSALLVVAFALTFSLSAAAAPPADCKKVEQKKRKGGRVAQLLAVAKCHAGNGQYTAAWYEYAEAAQRARDAKDGRSLKIAQKGERENAGLLAWVTVTADKYSEVDIDGEKTVSGAKKALDPGKHTHRCLKDWLDQGKYRIAPADVVAQRYAHLKNSDVLNKEARLARQANA